MKRTDDPPRHLPRALHTRSDPHRPDAQRAKLRSAIDTIALVCLPLALVCLGGGLAIERLDTHLAEDLKLHGYALALVAATCGLLRVFLKH